MSYLQLLLIAGSFPFLLIFLLDQEILFKYKKIFWKTTIGSLIFACPLIALSIRFDIWYYPRPLTGLSLLGIPLEEYLFIIFTSILLTYNTLFFIKRYAS